MNNVKCSLKKHLEENAIYYCQDCNIYMCNKCSNHHLELFEAHNFYKLDKIINEIFTGFCKEKNHLENLKYFCKTHNILCCAACMAKIIVKGVRQHSDCNVCIIEDIKEEKKNKLKENLKYLDSLSNNFQKSIEEIKIIIEKLNENKDKLKEDVQKLFTKIRNELNNREDELLLEIDKQYQNLFSKDNITKDIEKLPNKIKISLDKGKKIDNDWDNENKLSFLINDCLHIENNIQSINIINQNVHQFNNLGISNIKFYPDKEDIINDFIYNIKTFGKIGNVFYIFKKCPINVNENRKYALSGNDNIMTKIGTDYQWMGTICENKLEKGKICKWKIKILKTKDGHIDVGVADSNFDINTSTETSCGWYFACDNQSLYSQKGKNGEKTNLKKPKEEVVVVMDMNKGTLKFIIDNEDKGISYNNIPMDKPLFPAVLLYHINDSIEILDC